MADSFLTAAELGAIGFNRVGEEVLISRKASIYLPGTVSVGNRVRIDDFCILSGEITVGDNVHISARCSIYGRYGFRVELQEFSGLSPGVTVFSAVDDFAGDHLVGAMVPQEHRRLKGGAVTISRFVQIGASSVVMPGVTVGEGSVVGALSLVNRSLDGWGVYAGVPVTRKKDRSRGLLARYRELKGSGGEGRG